MSDIYAYLVIYVICVYVHRYMIEKTRSYSSFKHSRCMTYIIGVFNCSRAYVASEYLMRSRETMGTSEEMGPFKTSSHGMASSTPIARPKWDAVNWSGEELASFSLDTRCISCPRGWS